MRRRWSRAEMASEGGPLFYAVSSREVRKSRFLTRRHHLEVADQALGPVPGVLELAPLDLARPHRPGRGDPLQRLDAGHLVHADGVDPVASDRCGAAR